MKIKDNKTYRAVTGFFSAASEKRIDTYSAGAAFYIYMSFIPFALIVLSTVKYMPFTKQDVAVFVNEILPLDINHVIVNMIDELYSRGAGVLSVSIIAAVWASAKGVFGISKGLNEIIDCTEKKSNLYMRTKSAVCTLLLMLGMILLLVLSVFKSTIMRILNKYLIIPRGISGIAKAGDLIMFAVLFVVFVFFFCVLPEGKVRIRSQLPGAACASFLWIVFTKLFSLYLMTFNGYSMYGSFAVILVLGIWLYTGMYIMFMGALLNEVIASRKG